MQAERFTSICQCFSVDLKSFPGTTDILKLHEYLIYKSPSFNSIRTLLEDIILMKDSFGCLGNHFPSLFFVKRTLICSGIMQGLVHSKGDPSPDLPTE